MFFIISARTPYDEVRFRRASMIGAFDKSLALLGVGMEEVHITNLSGASRTPVEFSRVLLEGRKPCRNGSLAA